MPRPNDAPRDLLFGLLALQNGMVTRDQLVMAFTVWTATPGKTLADLLAKQSALRPEHRPLLDALADAHIKLHGGDPEKSLAALGVDNSTRESLAAAGGPEIEATLHHLGSGSGTDGDGDRTASYAVGTATADGQRFRVLRPHARGGLGAVFVALDAELNREVALKQILDQHADDPSSRARFVLEAEITGGLEHPGIVPVYGLGSYDGGRPFYAMRFIKGDSLKEAADRFHTDEAVQGDHGRRALELRKLLHRFTDVCDAIGYAHARGVLHRDIKPGNIIVGKYGETLVVDWGLAKATGRADPGAGTGERTLIPSSASGSAETLPGSGELGTPAYMSPEQAEGDFEHLGPRSDVYSLGATLYYILTGKPPIEGDIGEVLRAAQRGEFPPPRRHTASIDPALEAVCLKAMAHRPADRYASPRALSEDIERWMADEPVSAWREPLSRRVRRWANRNRTAVAAAAVALIAGVVGLSAVLAVQTSAKAQVTRALGRERDANQALAEANDELARSKTAVQARYDLAVGAIQAFHTGVSEDFLLKQDQFKELRDRLLKSAQEFYGKLSALLGRETDPASRRALLRSNYELAGLTGKVGSLEDALKSQRAVLAAHEALAAEPGAGVAMTVDVGRSLTAVATLLAVTGKTGESVATYRRSESLLTGPAGTDPAARAVLAECRSRLGGLLSSTGQPTEALAAYRLARADQEALAAVPGAPTAPRRSLADTIERIGVLLWGMGRPTEAEAEYRRAMEIHQKLAVDHPAVSEFRNGLARSQHNLAILLGETDRPTEGETEYRRALEIYGKLAADHPAVTDFRSNLALLHRNLGSLLAGTRRPSEAEAEYRRALEIYGKLAADHPTIPNFRSGLALSHVSLGIALAGTGRATEAEAEYRQAMEVYGKLAADHPTVTDFRYRLAGSHVNLGDLLADTGKPSVAEAEYRRALAIQEKLAAGSPAITNFRSNLAGSHNRLGILLSRTGRPAEAEGEYRRAMEIREKMAADYPAVTDFRSSLANSHHNLAILLVWRMGKPTEAEAEFRRALEIYGKLAADHPAVTGFRSSLALSHLSLGAMLSGTGRPTEEEGEYRRALEIYGKLAADYPAVTDFRRRLADSRTNIATLLSETGRPTEVEGEYRRALEIYEKLAADQPAVTDFRSSLADSRSNLASLLSETGRPMEAEGEFRRALEIYRKLAADNPNVPWDRNRAADLDSSLSVVLRRLRRPAEARDHAERAVAASEVLVREDPRTPSYRAGLAANLHNRGLARRAVGDAAGAGADLRRALGLYDALPPRSGVEWFNFASSHAALSGLAGREGSGVSAAEAVTEADAAMALLRKAVEMGYRNPNAYRAEDALDPLRSRDDFKLLMMDLAMPAAPFAAER